MFNDSAVKIQRMLLEEGIAACLKKICGLEEDVPIFDKIIEEYKKKQYV